MIYSEIENTKFQFRIRTSISDTLTVGNILRWLEENFGPRDTAWRAGSFRPFIGSYSGTDDEYPHYVDFVNKEHAMLFKLVWSASEIDEKSSL